MGHVRPEIRTFFISVVGLSTVVWKLAFNLGAFRTIFFETIFGVWVAVTVILVALLFMPEQDTTIPWWGKILMILPTLALLSMFFNTSVATDVPPRIDNWLDTLLVAVGLFATVVSFPYAIYVAVAAIKQSAIAKVNGTALTMSPNVLTNSSSLALIKVSLIQAMPKMATTAVKPEIATFVRGALDAGVLVASNMIAVTANMVIWIMIVIERGLTTIDSFDEAG